MMSLNFLFFGCLALFQAHVNAFTPIHHHKTDYRNFALAETKNDKERTPSRRSFLNDVGVASSLTLASIFAVQAEPAFASGGATAGGAYLLSAKQRYNDRVITAIKALLLVEGTLESGSIAEAKQYFSGEAVGEWKDFASAGYLLSNAFRRSSSTAPDSLPAVKKWKAFAAQVELLQKALKKTGASGASGAFPKVEEALENWLAEVALPTAREL